MRRFAGHIVLVVAAFASIATSKPKWHVEAHPPATQISGDLGSLAVIEASQVPDDVHCVTAQFPYLRAALRTNVGTRYEYLCPPGSHFGDVVIAGSGSGRGCGKPETPDDAFVRFVELKPVKMWRAEARTAFPMITETLDAKSTYASGYVEVTGAVISIVDAAPGPGTDPNLERPRVSTAGVNRFEITMIASGTEPRRAEIAVHAVGYGICEQDCTPGEIRVDRAR